MKGKKMKFEAGKTYNLLTQMSLREDGPLLRVSRRITEGSRVVEPSDNMLFKERRNGLPIFALSDGTEVVGHNTHFDSSDKYNTGAKSASSTSSLEKKIAAADSAIAYRQGVLTRAEEAVTVQQVKLAALVADKEALQVQMDASTVHLTEAEASDEPNTKVTDTAVAS